MLTWHEIIQKYIIRHSDTIRKITSPLKTHFGVEYFTYHKIDPAGRYTVLLNRPDWAEKYVDEKIYLNDPYLRHPENYEEGITCVGANGSNSYKKKILIKAQEILNSDTCILLIQKQGGTVEFFGYSANNENRSLLDLALNNQPLLKSFGDYFKQELKIVLQNMEEGFLPALKGSDFFQREKIGQKDPHTSFLAEIGLAEKTKLRSLLTKREVECLQHLIEGYTLKETAFLLNLSSRTVESYINNIKSKWDGPFASDVKTIARELKQLGLLP